MAGLQVKTSPDELEGPRWSRVIILSLLFHIVIFSVILFVPDSIPTRRISGATVYQVNLVEMPGKSRSIPPKSSNSKMSRKVTSSKESTTAKRISRPSKEEKPVVIGKRVVKRKKEEKKRKVKKTQKPRVSPSRLIDRAVSKIEKKVKAKKNDHLAQAISKIQVGAEGVAEKGAVRGNAETGITIRMYQMAVEEQIKSNWSYPVALISPKKLRELEAIVVIKVKENGTIMKSWFMERSSNSIFDGSVLKAIERSDPLPPFPEGYRKSYDEIEIRFNLSELEDF